MSTPISRLANYFMTELSAVFYLSGISLEEATDLFQREYCRYATERRGTQVGAADALRCHRNTVSRILDTQPEEK